MLAHNIVILLLCILNKADAILCYNGTFSYKTHGDDPLSISGFLISRRSMARLRCSMTIRCAVVSLMCFNCSSTHLNGKRCAGDFVPENLIFNNTRQHLANCTGENAMCFVRAWRARAKHSWIVQRGCYQSAKDDSLPELMNRPMRSMSCRQQRLAEAEYKVCLCQGDWCNSATYNIPSISLMSCVFGIFSCILSSQTSAL